MWSSALPDDPGAACFTHTVTVRPVVISKGAVALRAERTEMLRHRSLVIAQSEQWFVDAEVRETRRALLRMARLHTKLPALGFLDVDFLALADRSTVLRAIIDAAVGVGGAAAADLQMCDPEAGMLRIAEQRGFSAPFLAFFAHVGPGTPSACAAAWSTRAPVVVDQVTRSPIFAGHPTLEAMVDAGSRAVASYPLLGSGDAVAGVLSFHYPKPPADNARAALIARGAASALALLS